MNVYIMGAKSSSVWKVGSAKNVAARMRALQIGNPAALSAPAVFRCASASSALAIEMAAHRVLGRPRRRAGEWFSVPLDVAVNAVVDAAAQLGIGIDRAPPVTPAKPKQPRMDGLALREWRAALGLSQAEGAALLGIPHPTFRNWEENHRKIPWPRLLALAMRQVIAEQSLSPKPHP